MPEPRPGESQKEYISRCVSYCIKEEGLEQDHALGKCYGMWRSAHKTNEDVNLPVVNKIDTFLAGVEPRLQYDAMIVGRDEGGFTRVDVADHGDWPGRQILYLKPWQVGNHPVGTKGKVTYIFSPDRQYWVFNKDM